MPDRAAAIKKFIDSRSLQEVLQLYADGFSCKGIARKLNKTPKTVENQCAMIMNVLHTPNMCRAVVIGIKVGIIEVRDVEEE